MTFGVRNALQTLQQTLQQQQQQHQPIFDPIAVPTHPAFAETTKSDKRVSRDSRSLCRRRRRNETEFTAQTGIVDKQEENIFCFVAPRTTEYDALDRLSQPCRELPRLFRRFVHPRSSLVWLASRSRRVSTAVRARTADRRDLWRIVGGPTTTTTRPLEPRLAGVPDVFNRTSRRSLVVGGIRRSHTNITGAVCNQRAEPKYRPQNPAYPLLVS